VADCGLPDSFLDHALNGDLLCHECQWGMKFEEVKLYDSAYVCPICDAILDEENLKLYLEKQNEMFPS